MQVISADFNSIVVDHLVALEPIHSRKLDDLKAKVVSGALPPLPAPSGFIPFETHSLILRLPRA